jgi:WD40 repeat protein
VLSGHTGKVRNVILTEDGLNALSASFDNTLKLWEISTGSVIRTFSGHRHWVTGLAFAPDGRTIASGSWDRRWALWDRATGKNLYFASEAPEIINSVAFSPNGTKLLTGCRNGRLCLWNVADRTLVRDFSQHTHGVMKVVFCDDVTSLSCARDGLIKRWDWDRPGRYEYFEKSVPQAREALIRDSNDAGALREFGRWYAFRGVYDWAVEFLEMARAEGADVTSLELARCYWHLGRRDDATREFRQAIDRREAPVDYLSMCLKAATEVPVATTATTQ